MAGEIKTPELMDDEVKKDAEHRRKMGKIVKEIEEILIQEEMTVGDLLEIFSLFTHRANRVFEKITIKEIKKSYGEI